MATPRALRNPPIVEALVDVRAAVTAPQEAFEAFAQTLRQQYPQSEIRRGLKAEFKVEHGKVIPPTSEDLGFQGILLKSDDGSVVVQVGPQGFTFNNLRTYLGGDALLTEALRVWSAFAHALEPESVTRVALKYINRLRLTYRVGEDFDRFLTAAPPTPEGTFQLVSEFLSRIISHSTDHPATVIVTQKLTAHASETSEYIMDVDVFVTGEFSVEPSELRPVLDSLRNIKNRTFFAHLTEEAVELYQ